MSGEGRIRAVTEWVAAAAGSLAFGASFGWHYGVNNQVVYLLGSLRMVTPGSFARDWFATQTTHYHPAYEMLGALLLRLHRDGALIGYGQTLVIACGMLCVFWLLRLLAGNLGLAAYLLTLAIAFETRTFSVGGSYVFDMILQPSTLASVGLLVAVPLFAQGKWRASSVALGASGLFHANYLVLSGGAFLVAHGLLGPVAIRRRLFEQFLMPAIVLLAFAGMIGATAGSPHAKEAQDIYFNVRSPHHFQIARFQLDLLAFTAWQGIGFGAILPMAKNRSSPLARVGALAAGLVIIVWLGLALSAAAEIRQATQLFAWRLAPHVELLLQAAACAVALRVVAEPGLARRWNAPSLALLVGGICLLATHEGLAKHKVLPALVAELFAIVLAVVLVAAVVGRFAGPAKRAKAEAGWSRFAPAILALGGVAIVLQVGRPHLVDVSAHSSMVTGINPSERELTQWMRESSPKDALFLTPPGIETLRYHSQRAIVVDWKSNPIVPDEVLEWHRRLEDVCGRPVRGAGDLGGYDAMDKARLER